MKLAWKDIKEESSAWIVDAQAEENLNLSRLSEYTQTFTRSYCIRFISISELIPVRAFITITISVTFSVCVVLLYELRPCF